MRTGTEPEAKEAEEVGVTLRNQLGYINLHQFTANQLQ